MKFKGGEFSTGTTGNFQTELTVSYFQWNGGWTFEAKSMWDWGVSGRRGRALGVV
jgi:hypothetical protein